MILWKKNWFNFFCFYQVNIAAERIGAIKYERYGKDEKKLWSRLCLCVKNWPLFIMSVHELWLCSEREMISEEQSKLQNKICKNRRKFHSCGNSLENPFKKASQRTFPEGAISVNLVNLLAAAVFTWLLCRHIKTFTISCLRKWSHKTTHTIEEKEEAKKENCLRLKKRDCLMFFYCNRKKTERKKRKMEVIKIHPQSSFFYFPSKIVKLLTMRRRSCEFSSFDLLPFILAFIA